MLWRVRAKLPDRPGVLALLTSACGRAEGNIVALHVFRDRSSVTDELVIDLRDEAGFPAIAAMVAEAGGELVSAAPCSAAATEDQPTRYVRAAEQILGRPTAFPEIAAELFDAEVAVEDPTADVLEMVVGDSATLQIRRSVPFTEVERERAAALADLVGRALEARVPVPSRTFGSELEYVAEGPTISALAGGLVAGRATAEAPEGSEGSEETGPWPVDIWVDPAWQRRGIGTRLLTEIARSVRARGGGEIVLQAPGDSAAVLPMVLSAGLRGRIRVADGTLTVRISLAELRATTPAR
ncbi:MAG TPA: GNAT family N-acetyltransferase [Nocardioides sp.]|nr:GNAT family N-acetyltransferase [Nocardioides sp.]